MDHISSLRNVDEALSEFEAGKIDLVTMEVRVRAILRSYATEFEEQQTYEASGPSAVDGLVVIADSAQDAREQIRDLIADDTERFDVECVD